MSDIGALKQGTLLVGIDEAQPIPLQQGRPENGDFRGYEVDLLEEIARQLGVVLEYRRALWSEIIADLSEGSLDAVCSAATVTAEREKVVDFCTPHLTLSLALVTREVENERSLTWRRIGVRRGTTAEAYAHANGVRQLALTSESNDELYAALAAGQLDVVVDDSPIAAHFARKRRLHVVPLPGTDAAYAIAVRKGNTQLRNAISRVIGRLQADDVLAAWRVKWGL